MLSPVLGLFVSFFVCSVLFSVSCVGVVGAPVYASDLRAGAALIIAGIIASGETQLFNLDHIDRGYENIEEKFRNLGANIKRVKE